MDVDDAGLPWPAARSMIPRKRVRRWAAGSDFDDIPFFIRTLRSQFGLQSSGDAGGLAAHFVSMAASLIFGLYGVLMRDAATATHRIITRLAPVRIDDAFGIVRHIDTITASALRRELLEQVGGANHDDDDDGDRSDSMTDSKVGFPQSWMSGCPSVSVASASCAPMERKRYSLVIRTRLGR